MTPDEFKNTLAVMVAAHENREAIAFVRAHLSDLEGSLATEDRMLVADWMEGVAMALDLAAAEPAPDAEGTVRRVQRAHSPTT